MPTSTVHLRYLRTMLATAFGFLSLVAGLNYLADPLWCFEHALSANAWQRGIDERQQKTNLLTYSRQGHEAVLIGSSRASFIDAREFSGSRTFNYAVSEMMADEYAPYVAYAQLRAAAPLTTVFVALDFFATSEKRRAGSGHQAPDAYFDRARDPSYRYRMLLSWDVLGHSLDVLWRRADPFDTGIYDRRGRKSPRPIDERLFLVRLNHNMRVMTRLYRHTYRYSDSYRSRLAALIAENPDTRFVAFTTPVAAPLFELLRREGRMADYRRWLGDAVEVFGSVHHFMDLNGVTRDMGYFLDASHFRPEVGRMIARKVTGAAEAGAPRDFGVVLTPGSLEPYLSGIDVPASSR